MSNQWFRMYAEFLSDPKVQMMSEQMQRRLIMLFCVRCNGDATLHDDEVAFQLRVTPEEWVATKAEFIKRGFIDSDNNIINWGKRQYVSDSSTERSRKHREKTQQKCNVAATHPDTEQIQIQNRTDTEHKDNAPEGVTNESWLAFLEIRKRKKAADTDYAIKLIHNQLTKLKTKGFNPQTLVDTSIRNSWKDIFEPKESVTKQVNVSTLPDHPKSELTPEQMVERRLNAIQINRRVGVFVSDDDEKFLRQYQQTAESG